MLAAFASFALFAVVGLVLQRRPDARRLRERIWACNVAVIIPAAAVYALLGVDLGSELVAIFGCGVVAWWITVGIAGLYARIVTSRPGAARGALTLVGAFPNTGFIGFPLALLVFGEDGLRTAVLFDQISLIIPAIVVATIVAQRAVGGSGSTEQDAAQRRFIREVVVSPPLWAVGLTLLVRAVWIQEPVDLDLLGTILGYVIGPIGFLLLGLSIPLGAISHTRSELLQVSGASVVRLAVGPAMVVLVAAAFRVDVPPALVFVAGLPTAFHALIVSRVYDAAPDLVRTGVLITTAIALPVAVSIAVGIG